MFARPRPLPPRRFDGSCGVRPRAVVGHREDRESPSRCADTSTTPPSARFAIPCRSAFSTSGWSRNSGTAASRSDVIDVEAHLEPIGKPNLLDREIPLEEAQLVGERHLVRLIAPQHLPQHIAQERSSMRPAVGGVLIANEHGDRVQAVEQEMRVQLHPQRA